MKAINNVILAGLGALALTREKAEEIVDTLIKRGDLARGDRKVAVEDLIAKAEEQAKKFGETMKAKAAEMRGVRRDEYESLKSEVDTLKATIERLKDELPVIMEVVLAQCVDRHPAWFFDLTINHLVVIAYVGRPGLA